MEGFIERLNQHDVKYLVIGGQAARLSGVPRFSMDWDLYIPPHDQQNFNRIADALGNDLDMPIVELGPKGENVIQTYQTRWGIIQFHLGGPGLPKFEEAAERAVQRESSDSLIPALCDRDLLASKRAANRPEDQIDIEFLEAKLAILSPPS